MVRAQAGRPDLALPQPTELPPLSPEDPLGRYVLSEKRARRALKRGIIAANDFLESLARDHLSVDRLDLAPDKEMAAIADGVAVARGRTFFGWTVVSVRHASEMGRRVEVTPLLDNPFHADIYLNLPDGAERRDAAKQHALNLAKRAAYRPRPDVSAVVE